jgi:hypothetical protein
MATIVRKLPLGLADVLPPNLLGFVVINGFTFAVDLGVLTILHSGLRWPLPVSITVAYVTAFGLSYLLNRVLNFRSHGSREGVLRGTRWRGGAWRDEVLYSILRTDQPA